MQFKQTRAAIVIALQLAVQLVLLAALLHPSTIFGAVTAASILTLAHYKTVNPIVRRLYNPGSSLALIASMSLFVPSLLLAGALVASESIAVVGLGSILAPSTLSLAIPSALAFTVLSSLSSLAINFHPYNR